MDQATYAYILRAYAIAAASYLILITEFRHEKEKETIDNLGTYSQKCVLGNFQTEIKARKGDIFSVIFIVFLVISSLRMSPRFRE